MRILQSNKYPLFHYCFGGIYLAKRAAKKVKIPKEVLSNAYRELSVKRRIALRRALDGGFLRLRAQAEKLADEMQEANRIIHSAKPITNRPTIRSHLARFAKKKKTMIEQLQALSTQAKPYFKGDFNPAASGKSASLNPLEVKARETIILMEEAEAYYKSAIKRY